MCSWSVVSRAALVAALALADLGATPAGAATLYVDAGNTTGVEDGMPAAPFSSIQRAIDAAVAGDVVSVAPGIYNENVTLKDLVAVASQKGPAVTIIDGKGGYVIGSWFQPGVVRATVDGFTIRNGSTLVHGVSYWTSGYTQIAVKNCVIRDGVLGVRASINSAFSFERTVFVNVYQAISTIWSAAPRLTNVTIDRAEMGAWLYQVWLELRNSTVTNSVVAFTAPYYGYVYGTRNNFYGNGTFSTGNVSFSLTESLNVDPLFESPPDDYRLKSGSPLIDAGVDVGLPFYGAAPDIGAYEWMPADPAELLGALAVSIHDAPPSTFKSPEEQRRNAVYRQLMAAMSMFESMRPGTPAAEKKRVLTGISAMLRNSVLAKADGFYGGNPANDWIVTKEEQDEFYPRVKQILDAIDAELAAIP